MWSASKRTPPYYPDAVTLSPNASAATVLARIDNTPGCSIKDSFAVLDLTAYGFELLLEAEWMVRPFSRPPKDDPETGWAVVRDSAALDEWEIAWRGKHGPSGIFLPALLKDECVSVLARYLHGRVVAGAVLNRNSGAVGLSNYFTDPSFDQSDAWCGCVRFAAAMYGLPLIGYESGDRLRAALTCGFEPAGTLRVWSLPT